MVELGTVKSHYVECLGRELTRHGISWYVADADDDVVTVFVDESKLDIARGLLP